MVRFRVKVVGPGLVGLVLGLVVLGLGLGLDPRPADPRNSGPKSWKCPVLFTIA